jgi:plasmid stability protein
MDQARTEVPTGTAGSVLDAKRIYQHFVVLMAVSLSIKNVPDGLAERLRERAARAHRSLQGELMAILEDAVYGSAPLTPSEAWERIRSWGVETSAAGVEMIRADRNAQ